MPEETLHYFVDPKVWLFVLLGLTATIFSGVWARVTLYHMTIGLITDFLDTLGIGSFAVTTTLYRISRKVVDELIPGTLNVGHALPTVTQAFIYIAIIQVEIWTLILTIVAAVLGAWLGAGVVIKWPRYRIQFGMGAALLVAAGFLLAKQTGLLPKGGSAIELHGTYLAIALVANFVFGALMMIGVGAYAPIMVMVSLLGMNPESAFPIMMGSCAFLMPSAGIRIIRAGAYDARAALGLTIGGIPAVLVAAYVVKNLPLDIVKWLVIAVVVYTGLSMLCAALQHEQRQTHNDH